MKGLKCCLLGVWFTWFKFLTIVSVLWGPRPGYLKTRALKNFKFGLRTCPFQQEDHHQQQNNHLLPPSRTEEPTAQELEELMVRGPVTTAGEVTAWWFCWVSLCQMGQKRYPKNPIGKGKINQKLWFLGVILLTHM